MKHRIRAAFLVGMAFTTSSALAAAPVDADSDGLVDINSLDDLNEMRNDLAGSTLRDSALGCPANGCFGYELTRDLDFDSDGDGDVDGADWGAGEAWVPVGTAAAPFAAQFLGNGHVIRNLRLGDIDGVVDYGLFGVTDGARIEYLRLELPLVMVDDEAVRPVIGVVAGTFRDSQAQSVYLNDAEVYGSTDNALGGLFGRAEHADLRDVTFSGRVGNGQNSTVAGAGGIAGKLISSRLHNARVRGSVTGARSGGLVETLRNSSISHSSSSAGVVGTTSAGGLVVTAVYDRSDDRVAADLTYYSMDSNYALSTVTASSNAAGGLVREVSTFDGATMWLRNSYARVTVTNQLTNTAWSNLIQRANGSVTVERSYWVRDPAGVALTQRYGNVDLPNHWLADLQCASNPVDTTCAFPNLYQNWPSNWDYGTATELPALKSTVFSPWLSADRPEGTGDHDSLAALYEKYPTQACLDPVSIAGKQRRSSYVFATGALGGNREKLAAFSAVEGLSCKNADQPDGACLDYRVSYLCRDNSTDAVAWGPWVDADDPTGTGDVELLTSNPACPNGPALGIKSLVPGVISAQGYPQKLRDFSVTRGLRCLNSDGACQDYEVRLECARLSDR